MCGSELSQCERERYGARVVVPAVVNSSGIDVENVDKPPRKPIALGGMPNRPSGELNRLVDAQLGQVLLLV